MSGGENVIAMALPEKIDTVTDMIIVSGRSAKHLKKLADTVVTAVATSTVHHRHHCHIVMALLLSFIVHFSDMNIIYYSTCFL